MHWHFTQTLNEKEREEWNLLARNELGIGVHPDRITGFLLGREALRLCFNKFGRTIGISDLKIKNFNYLTNHSDVTFSISHTHLIGAAIVGEKLKYSGLGIDVELENRGVKDAIIERISHCNDQSLDKINLWCVKEAAFKALMNTGKFHKNIEFGDIEIGPKIFTHSPTQITGEWDFENPKPFVMARAWIYN